MKGDRSDRRGEGRETEGMIMKMVRIGGEMENYRCIC